MAKEEFPGWHGTTIIGVRKGGEVVIAGDGQVSLGQTVIKGTARKVRRLSPGGMDVIAGFAGSTADAFTLLERLEKKLEATPGQLARASVELAKDWRTDKYLSHGDRQRYLRLHERQPDRRNHQGVIEQNDIRAAVSAGILTEQQASGLLSLADERRGARSALTRGDEPFELFKGFNEIFIVIGLAILSTGWAGLMGFLYTENITNPQQFAVTFGLIGAIVIWALSEYFVRHRLMVAPAIALSVLFALNAGFALVAYFAQPFMVAQQDYSSLPFPFALGTLALFIYWFRFRVPFARWAARLKALKTYFFCPQAVRLHGSP